MTSITAPVCMTCKHYRSSDYGLTCDAFPRGIPDVVLLDGNPHTEPIPGDHGITYTPSAPRHAGRRRAPRQASRDARG